MSYCSSCQLNQKVKDKHKKELSHNNSSITHFSVQLPRMSLFMASFVTLVGSWNLHIGQKCFPFSHFKMQSSWNLCLQGVWVTCSPSENSSKQIEHSPLFWLSFDSKLAIENRVAGMMWLLQPQIVLLLFFCSLSSSSCCSCIRMSLLIASMNSS